MNVIFAVAKIYSPAIESSTVSSPNVLQVEFVAQNSIPRSVVNELVITFRSYESIIGTTYVLTAA